MTLPPESSLTGTSPSSQGSLAVSSAFEHGLAAQARRRPTRMRARRTVWAATQVRALRSPKTDRLSSVRLFPIRANSVRWGSSPLTRPTMRKAAEWGASRGNATRRKERSSPPIATYQLVRKRRKQGTKAGDSICSRHSRRNICAVCRTSVCTLTLRSRSAPYGKRVQSLAATPVKTGCEISISTKCETLGW